MIKKCFILITMILFFFNFKHINASEDIDLSQMNASELLEFYKNNPDYGRKRIDIDYDIYKEGNYVVFRGEFYDLNTNNPIANELVKFTIGGKNYQYTTNNLGIFNLEINKDQISRTQNYTVRMFIDRYRINFSSRGEKLLNDSIYHFRVNRNEDNNGIHKLSIENIYNNSFQDGENGFTFEEKIQKKPSILGIQGIALIGFGILISFFISFFYFKKNFIQSRENYLSRYKKNKELKNIEKEDEKNEYSNIKDIKDVKLNSTDKKINFNNLKIPEKK